MCLIFPGDHQGLYCESLAPLPPDQKIKVQNLRQFLPKAFVLFHDKKKSLSDHHNLEDHDTWENGACTEHGVTAYVFLPLAAFSLPGLVAQFSLSFALGLGHLSLYQFVEPAHLCFLSSGLGKPSASLSSTPEVPGQV